MKKLFNSTELFNLGQKTGICGKQNMSEVEKKSINPNTVTGKINLKIIDLLKSNPDGLRWKDLQKEIEKTYPNFHPKTINGCIWQVCNKFPDLIYKPAKGLFKLKQ